MVRAIASVSAPEQVAPRQHFADLRLHAAEVLRAGRFDRLQQQPGQEVHLDRQARAALEHEPRQEPRAREEVVHLVDVAVGEDVLPRHEHLVEDEDRVVLVHPARERVVERRPHHRRRHLVRRPAEQLHAGRVGRHDADERERLGLDRQRAVVGDEVQVRQARGRRHDLGAADDQAGVGLLLDVHVDVFDLVERLVAIDRRVDDGVVDEGDLLLDLLVPALGVLS